MEDRSIGSCFCSSKCWFFPVNLFLWVTETQFGLIMPMLLSQKRSLLINVNKLQKGHGYGWSRNQWNEDVEHCLGLSISCLCLPVLESSDYQLCPQSRSHGFWKHLHLWLIALSLREGLTIFPLYPFKNPKKEHGLDNVATPMARGARKFLQLVTSLNHMER